MDNMGWNSPSAGTNSSNVQSSLWRDVPRCSNADYGIIGAKMNLGENLFHPSQGLQDINASNSSKDRNMIQQLAPSSDFTKFASNTTGLCTPLFNMPNMMSPLISSMQQALQTSNGMGGNSKGIPVGSLESLDCLLSTTNSNTDTSVEDDVISVMFPDCRNLWSFNSSSAISSGESENNGLKKGGTNTCHHANNIEETVSQSSSYQCQTRPSSSKRKNAQEDIIKPSVNYSYLDIFQSDSSNSEGGFKLITEKPKKPRLEMHQYTSNINFQHPNSFESPEPDTEAIAQMKEMIYRAAVFRPVNLGLEVVEKPKRKNVKISSDPQTVAARQRRERISERIRILQRLVPGGSKMDTASMLDEAANYLKFLRSQVKALETLGHKFEYPVSCSNSSSSNLPFSSPLLFNQTFPMYPFFQPQNPN